MKAKITIKECWELFLSQKTNERTISTYKQAWHIIKLLPVNSKVLELQKIINQTKEIIETKFENNNTRNIYVSLIKSFLKFFAEYNREYFNFKTWKSYPKDYIDRQPYTNEELDFLLAQLESFGNPRFSLIFKLLDYNGCRLSEFVQIKNSTLKKENYEIVIKSSKNGDDKPFAIPRYLIADFERYGINNYSYGTIKNLFAKFSKFIKSRFPEFKKVIFAHNLRHDFVNRIYENLESLEEVIKLTGHKNPQTVRNSYLKFNKVKLHKLLKQANEPVIDNLDRLQLIKQLQIERKKVNYLKQLLLDNGIDYESSSFAKDAIKSQENVMKV